MLNKMTQDNFIGGYSEDEIAGARLLAGKLNAAAKNLMNNEDFLLVYEHYTVAKVLDDTMKATMAADHRPEFFESVINSNAFKAYIEELVSYVDDTEE